MEGDGATAAPDAPVVQVSPSPSEPMMPRSLAQCSPRMLRSFKLTASPVDEMLGVGRKISALQRLSLSTHESAFSTVDINPLFVPSPHHVGNADALDRGVVENAVKRVFESSLPTATLSPSSAAPEVAPPAEEQETPDLSGLFIIPQERQASTRVSFDMHPVAGRRRFIGRWFMRTDVRLRVKLLVASLPLVANILFLLAVIGIHQSLVPVGACALGFLAALFLWHALSQSYVGSVSVEYRDAAQTLRPSVEIERNICRYIPAEFLCLMGARSIIDVAAGDRRLINTSVIFSGIRDFSSFISTLSQTMAFEWLVMFTGAMTPIVKNRHGLVEKFLGDGMMALNKNPAWALYTAMEMQRAVDRINSDKTMKGRFGVHLEINMGVSIHSGVVCAGVIGDYKRLAATTISNVVNLAARFERLTKYYGARILISSVTAQHIPCLDRYSHRSIGRVRVKGSTEVYDLIDIFHTDAERDAQFKRETKSSFEAGLELYADQQWENAGMKFKMGFPAHPPDDPCYKAVLIKLYFCSKYHATGVPTENWSGEDVWVQK